MEAVFESSTSQELQSDLDSLLIAIQVLNVSMEIVSNHFPKQSNQYFYELGKSKHISKAVLKDCVILANGIEGKSSNEIIQDTLVEEQTKPEPTTICWYHGCRHHC